MKTHPLPLLTEGEVIRGRATPAADDDGFGALRTERGLLPLLAMDVRGRIDGLLAQVTVRQTFQNAFDEPMEATYIFPLPDRAAVTRFRMEVAGRVVEGELQERAQARKGYDEAIAAGHRASIAEEERPGVFTLRVGNLPPGEEATVELALAGPLPFADGEVTFRFPMVVAPRYIPGVPLPGPQVGDGTSADTDAVPDASRISPPVLLHGFPNPVRLSIDVDVHEGTVAVEAIRSSLHAVAEVRNGGYRRISVRPGERLDRDFILRFRLATDAIMTALSVHPDPDQAEGTFALTLVPPDPSTAPAREAPRDVVFVLDRSGSMGGWKMVAARRAMARMIDTLGAADRFGVLAFDDGIETPGGFPQGGLVEASDRNRFRAVEFLATVDARGGTEMARPLEQAAATLQAGTPGRARILVLVTDGQVGNEDQLLSTLQARVGETRVFALGIDRAVNEGFLHRLAGLGSDGGACDVVESEDRLDEVMDAIHRRIGTPVLTGLSLAPGDLPLLDDALAPERIPDLFASAPVLLFGRYRGAFPGRVTLSARDRAGRPWSQEVAAHVRENPVVASVWARGQVRKLEDRYAAEQGDLAGLEKRIIATSLRFGVLSRFTAYLAVDRSEVVNEGGEGRRIVQPVEMPQGWGSPGVLGGPVGYASAGDGTRGRHGPVSYAMPMPAASRPAFAPPSAMPPDVDNCLSLKAQRDIYGSIESHDAVALPPVPDAVRADAGDCLDALRGAPGQGDADALTVLRALVGKLQAIAQALKALRRGDALADGLIGLLREIQRLLRRSAPKADDAARLVARLEPFLEQLAGRPGGPGTPPGPPKGRREGFWK